MESDPFGDGHIQPWLAGDPWERKLRELLVRMDRSVEVVIVEGPNDRSALRSGGVTVDIHECSTGRGVAGCARTITGGPVAILTDYDDHGRRLNGELRDLLPDAAVAPHWRQELGLLLTSRGRYDIESLNNVFTRRKGFC